ncbi:MAG: UDP-4-amino-4,6-dideoxy-N-acetyl-beta-L-altrosamine transaminase [Deltaproteobacteria bacterium]|nr:UDP-4-amino-4,6-dideoxy-N-acetyl-beta-L-altrosamine transaminase [Deltaproteobacteria bacterium]
MRKAISYGRQTIDQDDINSVVDVLKSDMLTQGPKVEEFEEALKNYTGAKYAVCCSSGTAALHLAYLAANIGKGDSIITSPVTFTATANAAMYVGALPVFADIDPDTGNIDPVGIEDKIKYNPSVKAIVPVHYAGFPCDMERISKIALKNNLIVIEDGCHALGAMWEDSEGNWHKVGSSTHSDMTVFSFHPVKSITTGEGGAITTNSKALYERLKSLRSHGITRSAKAFVNGEDAPWYYEMHELGFNYRLNDIQCALGTSQLKKLDKFVIRRSELACLYSNMLSKYPFIKTPATGEKVRSAHHLYPVQICFDELGISKKELFESLKAIGIHLQVHYIPVHLQPYYKKAMGYREGDYPKAERFYKNAVSLPIYPLLSDEEAGAVSEALISTIAYIAAGSLKAARA